MCYKILVGNLQGKRPLERLGIGGSYRGCGLD
jgi:hypothetical protein